MIAAAVVAVQQLGACERDQRSRVQWSYRTGGFVSTVVTVHRMYGAGPVAGTRMPPNSSSLSFRFTSFHHALVSRIPSRPFLHQPPVVGERKRHRRTDPAPLGHRRSRRLRIGGVPGNVLRRCRSRKSLNVAEKSQQIALVKRKAITTRVNTGRNVIAQGVPVVDGHERRQLAKEEVPS
jgi:hypothetical protein